MGRRTVWVVGEDDLELYRTLSGIVDEYGWGGIYMWLSRRGRPSDFVYKGKRVRKFEI